MNRSISVRKQKAIFSAVVNGNINRLRLARTLKISRNTVKMYVGDFLAITAKYHAQDLAGADLSGILKRIAPSCARSCQVHSARLNCLLNTFSKALKRINEHGSALLEE